MDGWIGSRIGSFFPFLCFLCLNIFTLGSPAYCSVWSVWRGTHHGELRQQLYRHCLAFNTMRAASLDTVCFAVLESSQVLRVSRDSAWFGGTLQATVQCHTAIQCHSASHQWASRCLPTRKQAGVNFHMQWIICKSFTDKCR